MTGSTAGVTRDVAGTAGAGAGTELLGAEGGGAGLDAGAHAAAGGTTIAAGRASAARPSPPATVRRPGPMPKAQREEAGALFGAPCDTIRRFRFTTSVSGCSYPETSESHA
jgi:hypothetical protein